LVIQALNYVASEAHASIGHLFNKSAHEEATKHMHATFHKKLAYLEKQLTGKTYLVGDKASIADFYLYIVLSWHPYVGVSLEAYPNLVAYSATIGALEPVAAAHARMATSPATVL